MDDLGWERAVEVLGGLEKDLEFWRGGGQEPEVSFHLLLFPPGIWDFHFPLRPPRQRSIPPASCGDLLPLQPLSRRPTLLTPLCILVYRGGKGWDQSEILEEGLGNQDFLLLLLQEKATFSSL